MSPLDLSQIDRTWTLFLDRDGVINRRIVDGYVRNWSEWEWRPGVKAAIAEFSRRFGRVIVVTNQRGIARGLMSEADLAEIHRRMIAEVEAAGGHLDAVFHCPEGDDRAPCRKPNPGMLFRAADEFPALRWQKCLMVGDARSDMEMAWTVGIYAVFIGKPEAELREKVDLSFPGLPELAAAIRKR
ncbi:MAG: HAD family hydrolase [Bacteroidota bacterium]